MAESFSIVSQANSTGFGLLLVGLVVLIAGTFFTNKTNGTNTISNVSWTTALMGVCCICTGHVILFMYD